MREGEFLPSEGQFLPSEGQFLPSELSEGQFLPSEGQFLPSEGEFFRPSESTLGADLFVPVLRGKRRIRRP